VTKACPLAPIDAFPPILGEHPEILILGSMPSVHSLAAQQYYAHPRNQFWSIMAQTFQFDLQLDYTARCDYLKQHHIAVWDVLARCVRPGSADSNIKMDSIITNDFKSFLSLHPSVKRICFNGTKAESLFKQVYDFGDFSHIAFHRLPSTSPAHAAQSFQQKYTTWFEVLTST
jgi:hypoxanthine-DNA glycosylase